MVDNSFAIATINAVNAVDRTTGLAARSVAKLSSGSSAPDASANAAALAISSRLVTSVTVQNRINANISMGESIGRVAEAAYANAIDLMTRMKTLALQSTNGALSDRERNLLDAEYQNLLTEIDRSAKDATVNGIKVAETGIVPIIATTPFDGDPLPAGSFIPTGGNNTAIVNGGLLRLIDEPDPPNIQGVYLNDLEFVLEAGLTAEFNIEVGLPAGTSPTNLGGGFSFFLFDADQVDFSGANGDNDLGGTGAGNLLYYNGANPANGGFLAIGFESNGGFGNTGGDDAVTVVGPQPRATGQLGTVNLLTSGFPSGLDGPGAASADGQVNRFNIQLEITEALQLSVRLTNTDTGASSEVVTGAAQDLSGLAVPRALKFGFGATIAGLNNRFAVDDFTVLANADVKGRMQQAEIQFRASNDVSSAVRSLAMPLFDATALGLTINDTNIRTVSAAQAAITRLDFGLEHAVEARAVVGAAFAKFENARDFLSGKITDLENARSQIADLNVARELSVYTALQLQQQSGFNIIREGYDGMRNATRLILAHESISAAPGVSVQS